MRESKGGEKVGLRLGDDWDIDISLLPRALFQITKNHNATLVLDRTIKLILLDVEHAPGGDGFWSTLVAELSVFDNANFLICSKLN
eukprot:12312049-Ditylum_brightwellii.AAC.2